MSDVKIDHTLFVSQGAQENYTEMARDLAKVEGCSVKAAFEKLAAGFEDQHKKNPNDGWDHLAEWAKTVDPGPSPAQEREAYEVARAVESAKREPKLAYQSHPLAVKAAEETLKRDDEVLDRPDGILPNTGPAKVSKAAAEGKK